LKLSNGKIFRSKVSSFVTRALPAASWIWRVIVYRPSARGWNSKPSTPMPSAAKGADCLASGSLPAGPNQAARDFASLPSFGSMPRMPTSAETFSRLKLGI